MSHFYGPDAELHAFVPYAGTREGMRPATLADARKNGWLPSVTTVLSDLNKEQLNQWRVEQGVIAALKLDATLPEKEIVATVVKQSEEYRDWAAGFGTAVHDGIAKAFSRNLTPSERVQDLGLLGVLEIVEGFLTWADANALVVNESELSFSSSLGWGGTIDGLGTFWGEPGLFDWKTQDYGAKTDKNQKPSFYDPEWPLQMAGYDIGYRMGSPFGHVYESVEALPRISFVISRTVPGLVTAHQWGDPERYDAAWLSLWAAWKALHRWGEWAKKPELTVLQGGLELTDA